MQVRNFVLMGGGEGGLVLTCKANTGKEPCLNECTTTCFDLEGYYR